MTEPEEEVPMEQLLAAIAADWRLLQTLRVRLPWLIYQALDRGIGKRKLARLVGMPEPTVRRMGRKASAAQPSEVAA